MIGLKYLLRELKDYKDCILKVKVEFILYELKYAWQRAYKGYDDPMVWSIDNGFIQLYLEILKDFKNSHNSRPHKLTDEEWGNIIDEMIECLSKMSIDFPPYDKDYEEQIKYKDRFFELFGKYFYHLWD